MKDFLIILFFIGFFVLGGFGFVWILSDSSSTKQQPNIEKLLEADKEITDRIELLLTVNSIILCESSGKHENTWGDKNYKYPAYGIGQFQKRTFYWLSEKAGYKNLKWESKKDQVKLLMWAVDNKYGKLWTCYKNIK